MVALGLSVQTVNNHIKGMFKRAGVHSKSELLAVLCDHAFMRQAAAHALMRPPRVLIARDGAGGLASTFASYGLHAIEAGVGKSPVQQANDQRADVQAESATGELAHGSASPGAGYLPVEYLYEPAPQEIFDQLLPRYVDVQVYRALLESNAAFFAAQMTAMDTATKNSADMLANLTLYMNKVRQAAITREIIEVVSGAEAL